MKTILALSAFALLSVSATSAFAQSYSMPGNDPVRGHTSVGDGPIDYSQGGTLCYKTKRGVVCRPAETFQKPRRARH